MRATRPLGGRRGASAVEFALTAPVLIVLAGAIIEYGSLIRTYQIVANVAHDAAARAATLDQDEEGSPTASIEAAAVQTATDLLASQGLAAAPASVTTQVDGGAVTTLTVNLSVEYGRLFSLVPAPDDVQRSHTVALRDQG